MQNKTLLYWILDADGKPQYINASGNLETGTGVSRNDGSPANLDYSPEGWLETLVKWARNNKYLGLFREFSVPMIFRKDGAKILRTIKWRLGMEAVYYVAISKLNRTQFPDRYDPWYSGELDFSKYRQTDTGVDIQIVEGGLSKLLKAYESTTYELPVNTDPKRFSVYLDGLNFQNTISYTVPENQEIFGQFFYLDAGIISTEGTTQGVNVADSNYSDTTQAGDNWIIHSVTKNLSVWLKGSMQVEVIETGNIALMFKRNSPFQQVPTTVTDFVFHNAVHNAGETFTVPIDLTIPLKPDEFITLRAFPNTVPSGALWYKIQGGSFEMKYNVRFDPSLCECITWMRLFELITEKVTGGKYGCRSNFLSSLDRTQAVTCGQAIRKYRPQDQDPSKVQVLKTSFNDFYQAAKRWGIGLAIENNILVIEKHDYFFGNNVSIELGEVKDVEITDAEDLICNTIKVGYPNQEYDKVNGRDEFNVTQQYTTPLTRIVKEMDLVCPYRADMFGIELTRIDLKGQDTTDAQADNDTFIMNVVKGTTYDIYRGVFTTFIGLSGPDQWFVVIPKVLPVLPQGSIITFSLGDFHVIFMSYIVVEGETWIAVVEPVANASFNETITTQDPDVYHLNRPAYDSITGLINPAEAFNTELTPKHTLALNGAYIHSLLDLQEMNKIKFTSGEKNSELSTTLGPLTVTQKADINISSLPPKLFLPYYAKFKTKVLMDLPNIMRLQPYDKIGFMCQGLNYYAYLWSGGMAPAKNDAQEWQLMMAAENDMTKLI